MQQVDSASTTSIMFSAVRVVYATVSWHSRGFDTFCPSGNLCHPARLYVFDPTAHLTTIVLLDPKMFLNAFRANDIENSTMPEGEGFRQRVVLPIHVGSKASLSSDTVWTASCVDLRSPTTPWFHVLIQQ